MRDVCHSLFKSLRKMMNRDADEQLRTPCWEFTNCGRQPGGSRVRELGVCPVADAKFYHGTNSGACAGRICWKLCDSLAHMDSDGDFMRKLQHCMRCDFFKTVRDEEGEHFKVGL